MVQSGNFSNVQWKQCPQLALMQDFNNAFQNETLDNLADTNIKAQQS
jgi:hypothetical protein